jgi:asparagine synthetase B (glutamine-hydrolysing)
LKREYDDTLYQTVSPVNLQIAARKVLDLLKSEIAIAIKNRAEVSVATSGGWDSRLILGSIAGGKYRINCLTYGSGDLYETQIARRCADAIGASHEFFPIEEKYFPPRHEFEDLVKETESANYFEWFGIIEKGRLD